jgi:hypothetical protein
MQTKLFPNISLAGLERLNFLPSFSKAAHSLLTYYTRPHKTEKPPQEDPSSGGGPTTFFCPPEIKYIPGPLSIAEFVFCKHSSVNSYTTCLS